MVSHYPSTKRKLFVSHYPSNKTQFLVGHYLSIKKQLKVSHYPSKKRQLFVSHYPSNKRKLLLSLPKHQDKAIGVLYLRTKMQVFISFITLAPRSRYCSPITLAAISFITTWHKKHLFVALYTSSKRPLLVAHYSTHTK